MAWITVALVSYFINAGVYTADKHLLSKQYHSSATYAFYVGIWSIFNLVILVFDPWLPTFPQLMLSMSAGLLFLVTLIFWYKALHQSEATRVVPIAGALIPIFTFLLSYIFLGEELTERQLVAFIVLVAGGVLISVRKTRFYVLKEIKEKIKGILGDYMGGIHAHYRPTRRLIINSVVAAFFFASYYVLIKYVYTTQPFIGGFVFSRIGSFLGALLILTVPTWRKLIKKRKKKASQPKNLAFFLGVRLAGAAAFILLNLAISMGNVALINSLRGTQYLFLMIIVLFLSTRYPKFLKEQFRGGVWVQKTVGATLIGVGLYMLLST
ncbi:MAG: EamA family transporter [Patescibacteria group bacterium]